MRLTKKTTENTDDKSPGFIRKLWGNAWFRNIFYIIVVVVIWQIIYTLGVFPEILFPSMVDIFGNFVSEIADGSILARTGYTLAIIFIGMGIAVVLAIILTVLAMISKTAMDLISTLITVLDPLPGIAILPVAILIFGLGSDAIVFVMIHSIIWPMLLNIISGFKSVPAIYTEIGQSIGLHGIKMLTGVYIPASIPSILAGFKTGWSRAWRAFISAEMVFGAAGLLGGLGWDLYMKKAYLDMAGMYSTLIVIMIIGVIVEHVVFRNIEKATVKKWGMVK